jgi:hypothetical protein
VAFCADADGKMPSFARGNLESKSPFKAAAGSHARKHQQDLVVNIQSTPRPHSPRRARGRSETGSRRMAEITAAATSFHARLQDYVYKRFQQTSDEESFQDSANQSVFARIRSRNRWNSQADAGAIPAQAAAPPALLQISHIPLASTPA